MKMRPVTKKMLNITNTNEKNSLAKPSLSNSSDKCNGISKNRPLLLALYFHYKVSMLIEWLLSLFHLLFNSVWQKRRLAVVRRRERRRDASNNLMIDASCDHSPSALAPLMAFLSAQRFNLGESQVSSKYSSTSIWKKKIGFAVSCALNCWKLPIRRW